MRRSASRIRLISSGRSVNSMRRSPCASAGMAHSGKPRTPRPAMARLLLITSRRVVFVAIFGPFRYSAPNAKVNPEGKSYHKSRCIALAPYFTRLCFWLADFLTTETTKFHIEAIKQEMTDARSPFITVVLPNNWDVVCAIGGDGSGRMGSTTYA